MKIINNERYDGERALYGSENLCLVNCSFDGEADGESALKESNNVLVESCYFNLRYPFWHVTDLTVAESEMTLNCRAPLWYTKNAQLDRCKINGVKAIRECENIRIFDSNIISSEFCWYTNELKVRRTTIDGEYMLLKSSNIDAKELTVNGKYAFQYIENAVIENSILNTKDAFWHAKNVVVKNSVIKGEYLGWYSENLTLENCKITGTQPLCYCKGLTLINCEMHGCDLSFEKSDVNATILNTILSIKNPASGRITVPCCTELIMDDTSSLCEIITE